MELLHKALDFQIRQVGNPEDRVLEFIGSTADVDRGGDIIEVGGWDLAHYLKNPQFLWAHNYSVPPVGTTRQVLNTGGALAFQVYFPKDEEINVAGWPSHVPTPETVYRLYKGGFLRATSVGFKGLETEPILGEPDEQGFRNRTGTRFKKQDLYELSAVPVPANPYAVIQAVQKGIVSEEQAKAFELPEPPALGNLDQKLVKLGYEPIPASVGAETIGPRTEKIFGVMLDRIGGLIDQVEALQVELAEAKAQTPGPQTMTLVLDEKQLESIRQDVAKQFNFKALAKAGAVLSAKNKTALKNAQAMIQGVLDAAEPADGDGKDTAAPQKESIYSLALTPGIAPEGERQAGESPDADVTELRTLTQNLHLAVCKP